MANGSLLSHWTVRDSRREIRQDKHGLVLFETREKAKENVKKKQTKLKEMKKLEKQVKALKAKVPKP